MPAAAVIGLACNDTQGVPMPETFDSPLSAAPDPVDADDEGGGASIDDQRQQLLSVIHAMVGQPVPPPQTARLDEAAFLAQMLSMVRQVQPLALHSQKLEAIGKLTHPFGVVCFDGQGYAHPRRCGLASHAAIMLGVPGVGVALGVVLTSLNFAALRWLVFRWTAAVKEGDERGTNRIGSSRLELVFARPE